MMSKVTPAPQFLPNFSFPLCEVGKPSTGSSRNVNLGHRFLPPVFVTFKIEHTSPLGVEAVWGINLVITIILLERKNSQILWGSKCYWCFWTVVLEKTLESPLDCKEIQPVHPKGDQSWVFVRRTDVEAETPILWLPDVKSWFIGKDPDAGKVWGKEEKGMTEDEMVGWHHRLDGHGFGWTPGVGDGQGGLACCGSWGCKESHTTEQQNWTELATCKLM